MGVTNIEATKRRLLRLGRLPEERVKALRDQMLIEAFDGIISATPVDKGRLRAGWDLTEGARSKRVEPEGENKPDREPVTEATAFAAAIPAFTVVHITNNVPYAEVVESGLFEPTDPGPSDDPRPARTGQTFVVGGFSTSAPAGMLRAGLTRIAVAVRRASAALP